MEEMIGLMKIQIPEIIKSYDEGYLLYFHSKELKGISVNSVDYESAKILNVGDKYIQYSVDFDIPCKKNFFIIYIISNKIVDENNNIILISSENRTVDLE